MIPFHIRFLATRAGRGAAFVLVLAALAIAACSSDPSSTLGSDDDLIGSRPGVIFEDTLDVIADTVLAYASVISSGQTIDLGRITGYERAMVFQVSTEVTQFPVTSASLRLSLQDSTDTISARFFQLSFPYANGDSIPSLDTLGVILDPNTGGATRTMKFFPRNYSLPPALVQGWLRGETDRNAIAVVYSAGVLDSIASFYSIDSPDTSRHPLLHVTFTNQNPKNYRVSADASFIRPTKTSPNLTISDGFVRRVYFRLPLDQLPERAAIQNARVRLYMVPGSTLGSDPNLIVYIPASSDPTSNEFLSGQNVTALSYQASADYIEFAMTNAIALTLDGTLADNGVVMRYDAENSSLRQVEFYGSNAPVNLRPRLYITASTPADFHPGTP